MNSVPNDSQREKLDLLRQVTHGKVVAGHWVSVSVIVALLIVSAVGLLSESRHNRLLPQAQTESRERADEVLGQAAVEAAAAGDYDTADDFLNYVHSDAICDDYSEDAAILLLTHGNSSAATAIAYKIEGVERRDRLLEQIECEAGTYAEIQEDE